MKIKVVMISVLIAFIVLTVFLITSFLLIEYKDSKIREVNDSCASLPEKLISCTPFSCFDESSSNHLTIVQVLSKPNGDCYLFHMDSNISKSCKLTEQQRYVMSNYYENVLFPQKPNPEEVDFDIEDIEQITYYRVNGKDVTDPFSELDCKDL